MKTSALALISAAGLVAAQNVTIAPTVTETGIVHVNSTVVATITSCGTGGCHKPTNGTLPTPVPPVTDIPIANGAVVIGGSVAAAGIAAVAMLL